MRTDTTIYNAPKKGTVRDRLEDLLEQMGFQVDSIIFSRGYWVMQDVHRWEAMCKDMQEGGTVEVFSWESAGACVSNPVTVTSEAYNTRGMFEVSTKCLP